jgi:hypothetical protein
VLTERAFSPSQHFSPKYNRSQTNLRRFSVSLQIVWILSELAFSSAFAPLLLAVFPSLALSLSGSIALCLLPLAAMVSITACLEFFSKMRRGRRHRRLSSVNSEDFEQLTSTNSTRTTTTTTSTSTKYPSLPQKQQSQQNQCSDIFATPPLSPADSFASGSSGALASGLPSPTGHCPSPDRAAMLRYATRMQENGTGNKTSENNMPSAKDVFLMEHPGIYLDAPTESMLFVHKILKPIKTRIGDQEPVPPTADYKPLLQQLIAQSQSQHIKESKNTNTKATAVMQPCPPLFQPAVIATITVVKGKGNNTNANVRMNQPAIPIPVIS